MSSNTAPAAGRAKPDAAQNAEDIDTTDVLYLYRAALTAAVVRLKATGHHKRAACVEASLRQTPPTLVIAVLITNIHILSQTLTQTVEYYAAHADLEPFIADLNVTYYTRSARNSRV